eukprot:2744492-Prymnesium_polylepis.1
MDAAVSTRQPMSRRTRGLCRRSPTGTARHGGSTEVSTSFTGFICRRTGHSHVAVPAPRKRPMKSPVE